MLEKSRPYKTSAAADAGEFRVRSLKLHGGGSRKGKGPGRLISCELFKTYASRAASAFIRLPHNRSARGSGLCVLAQWAEPGGSALSSESNRQCGDQSEIRYVASDTKLRRDREQRSRADNGRETNVDRAQQLIRLRDDKICRPRIKEITHV